MSPCGSPFTSVAHFPVTFRASACTQLPLQKTPGLFSARPSVRSLRMRKIRSGDEASLGLGGVHQLSMDGPNVNRKPFGLLSTQIEKGTR